MRKILSALVLTSALAMPFSAQAEELNLKIGDEFPDLSGYELMWSMGWHKEKGSCVFRKCDIENDLNVTATFRRYDTNENKEFDKVIVFTNCSGKEKKLIGILTMDSKKAYFGYEGKVEKILGEKDIRTDSEMGKYIPDCEGNF